MVVKNTKDLTKIIKYQRTSVPLTLQELSDKSSVSVAHLNRIERGQRFPSAHVLRKIAKPLGFGEDELFMLAGRLPTQSATEAERREGYANKGLDTYVASVLAQEPVKVQRTVIMILSILRILAKVTEKRRY